MAYVPGCEFDVFISYSHHDNTSPADDEPGWVTRFAADLRKLLATKLRQGSTEIYLDRQRERSGSRISAIAPKAGRAALLLPILSVRYFESDYCGEELEVFSTTHRSPGLDARIHSVYIAPVEDLAPPELNDYLWTRMYRDLGKSAEDTSEDTSSPPLDYLPLGFPTRDDAYWAKVSALAGSIAKSLEDLRQPPGPPRLGRRAVLLAEVTDDLQEMRDSLRQYLLDQDVEVLPRQLCRRGSLAAFEAAVRRDLVGSRLFVQLLSLSPGAGSRDLPQSYVHRQHELAEECGVEVMQWRAPTALPEDLDASQRVLLNGEKVQARLFEDFKRAVLRAAAPPPEPSPGHTVWVRSCPHDNQHRNKVLGFLQAKGVEYLAPASDDDSKAPFRDPEELYAATRADLIVYGTDTQDWVWNNLFDCYKKRMVGRGAGRVVGLAYMAPPPPEARPSPVSFQDLLTIDASAGLDDACMAEFLRRL